MYDGSMKNDRPMSEEGESFELPLRYVPKYNFQMFV
jgi:hypothetical protein